MNSVQRPTSISTEGSNPCCSGASGAKADTGAKQPQGEASKHEYGMYATLPSQRTTDAVITFPYFGVATPTHQESVIGVGMQTALVNRRAYLVYQQRNKTRRETRNRLTRLSSRAPIEGCPKQGQAIPPPYAHKPDRSVKTSAKTKHCIVSRKISGYYYVGNSNRKQKNKNEVSQT